MSSLPLQPGPGADSHEEASVLEDSALCWDALEQPSSIGRYTLLRELGRGAMARVYLARDEMIGRLVALKTFLPPDSDDPERIQMLRETLVAEARSVGRLDHENVVMVHDIVEDGQDGFYIVMEYVPGATLADRLASERPLASDEILDLIDALASGLDHFHDRGVIHCDIKPSNILLSTQGEVKITDFGIAWRDDGTTDDDPSMVFGTPQCMSPEQVLGHEVDRRTDVFALGVLLYEIFTDHKPFSGSSVIEITRAILDGQVLAPRELDPAIPAAVEAIILKALASEPEDRFASAGALACALGDVLGRAAGPRQEPHCDPLDATAILPASAVRIASKSQAEAPAPKIQPSRIAFGIAVGALLLLSALWMAPRFAGEPAALAIEDQAHFERMLSQTAIRRAQRQAERLTEGRVEFARSALAEGDFEATLSVARELLRSEDGRKQALVLMEELQARLAVQEHEKVGSLDKPDPSVQKLRRAASDRGKGTSKSPVAASARPLPVRSAADAQAALLD